jgi:hypothetical protein
VLDEHGEVVLEQKLSTPPKAMKQQQSESKCQAVNKGSLYTPARSTDMKSWGLRLSLQTPAASQP